MKVSLNTIQQYVNFELPNTAELVKRINRQLGGVEEVIDLRTKYEGIVIAKVVTAVKHPDSDHLHVCAIDDGGVIKNVERDEDGLVQVVCGAPNVRVGIMVAWLAPGTILPISVGTADPLTLGSRNLRGVMSHGMLASPAELGIGDNHEGILELTDNDLSPEASILSLVPGQDFSRAFELDDTIIDIENKMFTHRPDCFGQLGVAREIAGIMGHQFVSPDWYNKVSPVLSSGLGLELTVFNDIPEKVPRLMVVAMKNVVIKASPFWLQATLVRWGSKPISNVVDVTNYIMLLTAQPTHAYDYAKLNGHTLGARLAHDREEITLLNGKSYELTNEDIVIADGEHAIGLAGIMGGGNSEVDDQTKDIVLEVATFDMYTLRKSSMRHGIFTDALSRFNKGQSPLQNDYVLCALMAGMREYAGAIEASMVQDKKIDTVEPTIMTSVEFINARLGLSLTSQEMWTLLSNAECDVEPRDEKGTFSVTPPFWRTDLVLPEDIVEEIGRLYGFDALPNELPKRSMKPVHINEAIALKQRLRERCASAGANEVLTYSFVHENVLVRAAQDAAHAFRLGNALSPDLQYYKLSLTPSILDKIHMNAKIGYDQFALFEIGKVHFKGEMDKLEETVPNEETRLALVLTCSDKQRPKSAPYFYARRYLESVLDVSTTEWKPLQDYDLSKDKVGAQLVAPYDPMRAVVLVNDGQLRGVVGEFKQSVIKGFKLPMFSAGFEVDLSLFSSEAFQYRPLSRFPSIRQDISLKVETTTSYEQIYRSVKRALQPISSDILTIDLSLLGIYQPSDEAAKTVTFRVRATHYERTLTDAEVATYLERITELTASDCHAQLV